MAATACAPPTAKMRSTPHRSAAKSTSGAIFPPRPAGVQSTTSPHPAIRAGRASISTVEKSGALPPGM